MIPQWTEDAAHRASAELLVSRIASQLKLCNWASVLHACQCTGHSGSDHLSVHATNATRKWQDNNGHMLAQQSLLHVIGLGTPTGCL